LYEDWKTECGQTEVAVHELASILLLTIGVKKPRIPQALIR
jgi:hypothetical protein